MRIALFLLAAALTVGCKKTPAPAAEQPATSPGPAQVALAGAHDTAPPPGHAGMGGAAASGLTGTVVETIDAAEYTYMKLKTADGEVWAAINQTKVTKGSTVTIANPMPMDGFESKTLKRKFDRIVFGTLAGPPGEPGSVAAATGAASSAMPGGMTAADSAAVMAAQHAAAATGPEVSEKISVAKAEGAEGRTVAEVFAQRAALKGKVVAIRGKVVKFNAEIMERNWIHLRDGSGTAEGKDNDLTITTKDVVKKGDVVVVKGTVALDRDFGAGYTYTVVVEDAKVSK